MTVSTRRRYDVDSLLAVAVAVFTERGYDGTSMEDLARASGLSKSSLYHHIDSKEQLLRLALERAVEPLFAVTQEPAAVSGRAIERLEHVVRREVEVLADRLPYVTLLLRVHGNTEAERWALERRREFDRFVAGLVREAAADGDVRDDLDPAVVTRLLFGMINSLVEWYRPDPTPQPRADQGTLRADQGTLRADQGTLRADQGTSGDRARAPRHTRMAPADLAASVVRLSFDGLRRA